MKNNNFLQSVEWRKFQESVGRKTYLVDEKGLLASVITHVLPVVGKYFYIPKWPHKELSSCRQELSSFYQRLVRLAKKENAGWIRIEPSDSRVLDLIRSNLQSADLRVIKAPHDMQPREIFVLDISKPKEQLLAEMKSKTRYNIGVAQKKGVHLRTTNVNENTKTEYVEVFLKLTKEMAQRQGITAHPDEYYRKMIESLPEDMLKIYVAEYDGQIIAANLLVFYGDTATYLHGASSNEHRNVMAPYLLQWQAILDAKNRGCKYYDFGGVKTKQDTRYKIQDTNTWMGITNFKLGFSPDTKPVVFPGSYDIIINPRKYAVYRGLQRAKSLLYKIRK